MTTATSPAATKQPALGSTRDVHAPSRREDDRAWTTATQQALLNILEDSVDEKARLKETQSAILNMLEDLDTEKARIDDTNAELRTEMSERRRTEKILQRRTEDLASSNADLEQFAYVASHDLSEPLRAISGPIQLLARRYEGQLDAEADEYIGFAVDGCQRMQAIINGLLAYSRVGRLEGNLAPVDCNLIVTAALSGLASVIDETDAEISVGQLPTVRADVIQLSLVFQNLISNGLKFMAPGVRPHVVVGAEQLGKAWRFTVTDNGIGIEPQHRERIFGMFKRLHGREDYAGTGIGLALVKKILERHGGTIGIDTRPEGGSCFWFTLDKEEDITP
jgi:light-regulated signal transduction histidine kinase (bacteriophytochrome)